MQIAIIELGKNWEKVEELVQSATGNDQWAFDATKTYDIECRGARHCLMQDPQTPPDSGEAGVMLDNGGAKIVEYKKGAYARSWSICDV